MGRIRRKSAAVSDRPGSKREQPSMKVVTVKFGRSNGEADGHKISFSPGVWIFCDKQKDRQEGLLF